jgi:hypothetical protein
MASRSIMPVSLALVCAIMAIVVFTLWQAREDARTRAEREGENIVQAIEADVARNIEVYDLSLQGLREALATVAVAHVEREVQRLALFDRAASAKYMGALLVLNATGDIVMSSRSTTPIPANLADRDYFQIHQYRPDIGLYISRPFKDRLEHREDKIALSRRLADEDGKFAGVVAGTLRLSYFRDLFSRLNVGRRGLIALVRSDGTILMRHRRPTVLTTSAAVSGTCRFFSAFCASDLAPLPVGQPSVVWIVSSHSHKSANCRCSSRSARRSTISMRNGGVEPSRSAPSPSCLL